MARKPSFPAFPVNAKNWEAAFKSALTRAAKAAGVDVSSVNWECCTTDNTWGDQCGLVFFGADNDETNERCARWFEKWAHQNLRKAGVVGEYDSQESISFVGEMFFTRYANGTDGWHRPLFNKYDLNAMTVTSDFGRVIHPLEMRKGYATSYVYYPCAD